MAVLRKFWGISRRLDRVVKRAFDIITATTGLMIFFPIFLLVAAAIELESRGPIFCTQRRYGYDNKPVRIIRFRSNTRTGGFLSRTGINGLPTLINILLGEMSIVGPCAYSIPPRIIFGERMPQLTQTGRLKPGLTGWAQVHGLWDGPHTPEAMRRQIEYDSFYITNWSLLFDARVILMTLVSNRAYAANQW
jgi:lipopolysaccharide/colanic/teichoic acid biosynthesis glycosyltransferase